MDNNPGSTSAQGSSRQGSSRQGSTSRGVDLSLYPVENNLTPPRPNDKVVLEKYGLSITDVFIGNAQTKLYRSLSLRNKALIHSQNEFHLHKSWLLLIIATLIICLLQKMNQKFVFLL